MDEDLIKRLAREAGIAPGRSEYHEPPKFWSGGGPELEGLTRFAALIAGHCAQLVEQERRDGSDLVTTAAAVLLSMPAS